MMNDRTMSRRGTLPATVVLMLLAGAALGDAYEDLVTYDWTASREPLAAIEAEIRQAATPAARKAIEAKLLKALASPQATGPAKQFVCRMLRRAGSAACVPALARLLPDPKLSHPARFALEPLACPEAGAALRKALGELKGPLQIGAITSLGARRDARAVGDLAKLLSGGDTARTRVVLRALGHIATPQAAKVLAGATVSDDLQADLADASLLCADRMLADGKAAAAAGAYRKAFAGSNPVPVRIAALRGIVLAEKGKAAGLLLGLMAEKNTALRRAASRFAIEMPGAAATKAFAAALAARKPAEQIALLDVLTARGDVAAAADVTRLVDSKDEAVRVAAIGALGVVGDASCVAKLAGAASAGGAVGQAATNSLNRLKGTGVGEALAKLLDSDDPALRKGILKVLTARADKTTIPAMLRAARDRDAQVRLAAARGLTAVAGAKELPALVSLLLAAKDAPQRGALARALSAGAMRVDDVEARGAPIVAGLAKADKLAAGQLLEILGRCGGSGALKAVRARLDDADAEIATAAVRALHAWPDAAPAGDLLQIIRKTSDRTRKVLAFRGYLRMANMPGVRGAAETAGMYEQALKLASTTAEKKSVLGGLSGARSVEALKLIEPLLGQDALKAEAELAYLKVADNARPAAPDEARAALKKLFAATKNASVRDKARGILSDMDKYRGYVTAWLAAGPYTKGAIFKTAYPPEKKGAKGVAWKLLTKGIGPQVIDLKQTFPGDGRAAYAKTNVWSPADQDVLLEIGSDDGIKVWIGGKQVHAHDVTRACKPAQDKVKARLAKGWNPVLVKVAQGGGDWAFCLRVCKPDGTALDGLRVNVEEK